VIIDCFELTPCFISVLLEVWLKYSCCEMKWDPKTHFISLQESLHSISSCECLRRGARQIYGLCVTS
jgi:hypothetical protein